jgi:CheY-like chemotaxis protein
MAKRILIADDSLTIQKAFAMTFGGEDVTLLTARSADEGLTIARQTHPELVIADGVMPGRSGYDLCAAIKSDPALRGVPVYILASSHNPYDEVRGRQSGVDGQFIKPFEPVALVERVKEAMVLGVSTAISETRPSFVASASPATAAYRPVSASPPAHPPAPPVDVPIDDDYGEITINPVTAVSQSLFGAEARAPTASAMSEITPPPVVPLSPPQRPSTPAAAASVTGPQGGLRPSLIPGLRPGAAPPTRPGAMIQARPAGMPGSTPHFPSAAPPVATHPPSAHASGSAPSPVARVPMVTPTSPGQTRTLMGLPVATVQSPGRFGGPAAPPRPPSQPVRTLDARAPSPQAPAQVTPPSPPTSPVASSRVNPRIDAKVESKLESKLESTIDQKIAAISAKGPEYEVIAKLSREIIEKIVWEIVPELAETIIREELQKRGRI